MKKLIAGFLALSLLAGCADNRTLPTVDGTKEVETYGVLNKDQLKEECINYELSAGNVIWSVILIETIVIPVYFIGFSLYEPVSVDENCLAEKLEKS